MSTIQFNLDNSRKITHTLNVKTRSLKTKLVWNILKDLWLDKTWKWTSDLSINHDNILYK